MPIYEYRCEACGHRLDALQKIADGPLTDCPSCSEAALRRLVSAPNFRLAGKGWYETDFKSDKETRRNLVDRPEESSAGKEAGETGKQGSESEKTAGDAKKGADSAAETSSTKSGESASSGAKSGSGSRTSDSAAA